MYKNAYLIFSNLQSIYYLCRPRNSINPLLAFMLGTLVAESSALAYANIFIASLAIILVNFFWTLQNDIEDLDIDRYAGRKTILTTAKFTPKQVNIFSLLILGAGVLITVFFNQQSTVLFVVIYSIVGWMYNSRPFQLSHKPISSIVALSLFLTVIPLLFGYYLMTGGLSFSIILIAIAGFLYRFSTSVLKDYKDYKADKKFRKQTFLIKFGPKKTKHLSIVFSILGYSLLLLTLLQTAANLLGVCLILLLGTLGLITIYFRYGLSSNVSNFQINNRLFHRILDLQLIIELGLLLCFYTL